MCKTFFEMLSDFPQAQSCRPFADMHPVRGCRKANVRLMWNQYTAAIKPVRGRRDKTGQSRLAGFVGTIPYVFYTLLFSYFSDCLTGRTQC